MLPPGYSDFVNACLNDVIEMDRDYMYYKDGGIRFSFLKFPFILTTTTKSLGKAHTSIFGPRNFSGGTYDLADKTLYLVSFARL